MAVKHLGCNVSIKLHFLQCHVDFFPESLENISEEHGEIFHHNMKKIEKC